MRFRGKIAWWFYAVMIGIAVVLLPITVTAYRSGDLAASLINLVVLAAIEGLFVPIAVKNYVELQQDALLIVFGLFKKKIPYSEIVSMSPTHNPLSSLAASLDRIEIQCRQHSSTMIAVVDKKGLLREIEKRNPRITVQHI